MLNFVSQQTMNCPTGSSIPVLPSLEKLHFGIGKIVKVGEGRMRSLDNHNSAFNFLNLPNVPLEGNECCNSRRSDRDPNPRLSSIISKSPFRPLRSALARTASRRPLQRMCVWRTAIPLRRQFLIVTLAYTRRYAFMRRP